MIPSKYFRVKRALVALRKILQEFDNHNVQYCLLRNYEFLFEENFPTESLDTVISARDFSRADAILRGQGFKTRQQQFSLQHKAYFKYVGKQMVSFDIQIGGIYWNDMLYLDEVVLANRVKKYFLY